MTDCCCTPPASPPSTTSTSGSWLASHGARSETVGLPARAWDVRPRLRLRARRPATGRASPRDWASFLPASCSSNTGARSSGAWRRACGDVVFAPLYQALRARGVRFAFFHRVDQLHVSDDGGSIKAVSVARQAQLADGREEYDPLVRIRRPPVLSVAPAGRATRRSHSPRPRVRLERSQLGRDDGLARRRGVRRPRARDIAWDHPSCLR